MTQENRPGCMSHENVKSIPFTVVSQLGANSEINFLIVYQNRW